MNTWKKSKRSGANGCVETIIADNVRVRDSKSPDGPILQFETATWAAFIDAIRTGRITR